MIRWPDQLMASKSDQSCGAFCHEADVCPGVGMLEYVAVRVALHSPQAADRLLITRIESWQLLQSPQLLL